MSNWKFFLDGNEVEEPIGWDAIEFTAIRMESHGIDQPFSTEVRFYNKGAKYIKSIYDQYFINQPIAIQITSDVGYNGTPYVFDGFLNLAIYEEHNVCDTDSWEITVGIIDDDFRESFKARQDVEVALETLKDLNGNAISELDYKNVVLHTQDLYLVGKARNYTNQESYLKFVPIGFSPFDWDFPDYVNIVPTFWGNSDFSDIFGSTTDTQGSAWSTTNCIFINNQSYNRYIDISASVKGGFLWDVIPPDGWFFEGETANVEFYMVTQDSGGLDPTYYLIGSTDINIGQQYSPYVTFFDLSNYHNSILVKPNYRVLFIAQWGQGGSIKSEVPIPLSQDGDKQRWLFLNITDVCVTISERNAGTSASTANGLTIEQYLKRLIYIMTGSNDKLISNAFSESANGCYWNNLLTNGLKIRNATSIAQIESGCVDDPVDETIIKTSWKKTFDNLDRIFCLGWAFEWTGLEWKIRVEPRDYFYQNTISQNFENVGEVTQMAKVDLLANNITIGYTDKWKNIAISGIWAIHTERNYFVGNKALNEGSSATLDLKSEIITEGYAIEFSRRLSFIEYDSGSSDRPNDYEIFLIWLNKFTLSGSNIENTRLKLPGQSGAYSFAPGTVSMPSDYIQASNSPLGGLYNIYHTPARVACRWWKVLGMHTYGLTDPKLRYQVGEYQTTYSSTINGGSETEACIEIQGGAIAEDSDISAAILNPDYQDYLFKPIAIEFSYPQSLCDFLTLSQDEQYKKVRLTSGSLDIQGFITQASNQPEDASGGTTKFTLLMSAQDALAGGAFDSGFNSGYDI